MKSHSIRAGDDPTVATAGSRWLLEAGDIGNPSSAGLAFAAARTKPAVKPSSAAPDSAARAEAEDSEDSRILLSGPLVFSINETVSPYKSLRSP